MEVYKCNPHWVCSVGGKEQVEGIQYFQSEVEFINKIMGIAT